MSTSPPASPSANGPQVPAVPPKRKLVWIEVARGMAAFLVILHHVSQHLAQELGYVPFHAALEPGSAAVDFFFVLSGFLILHVSHRNIGNPKSIGSYLRKRLLRIYPIYWAAVILFIAMQAASSNSALSITPLSLLHEASLVPVSEGTPLIVGVRWSLSYEIVFYGLFASYLFSRGLGRAVFAAWSAAALLRIAGVIPHQTNGWLRLLTAEYVLLFPLGMGIAAHMRRQYHPKSTLVLMLGIPVAAAGWYLQSTGTMSAHGALPRAVFGIASAMILYGLILRDHEGKTATWKPLLILGECSYSIYLFHLAGVAIAAKAISLAGLYGSVSPWLLAATMVASGLLVGVSAGVLVERPLVRWARRVA